jgi:hypothetical protein
MAIVAESPARVTGQRRGSGDQLRGPQSDALAPPDCVIVGRTRMTPAKSRSGSALEIPFHFYGLTARLFDKTRQLLGIERRLIDRRTPARADRRMPTVPDDAAFATRCHIPL